jgi:hypothetical protein
MKIKTNALQVEISPDGTDLTLRASNWPALQLGPLTPSLVVDTETLTPIHRSVAATASTASGFSLRTEFDPVPFELVQEFSLGDRGIVRLHSELVNRSGRPATLNSVRLLELDSGQQGVASVSSVPEAASVFEQGRYWARVRPLSRAAETGGAEIEGDLEKPVRHASDFCWVAYDANARMALAVGYETSERWLGNITTESRPDGTVSGWSVGFDGGATRIPPGEKLVLEDVSFLAGADPWSLLEQYADRVQQRHQVKPLSTSPVSWCSWYPYRLGVTEERVLANAQIAARRLKPLGFRIVELDLGWQREYLPNAFEENDQFPHGLKWLADRLEALGFQLGAWAAPFTISALDPVASEHPEWLLGGEGQKPLALGQWFWEPHGDTYGLDLTNPGAQAWLREKIRSLAVRGVRYLKPDFIGGVTSGRLRDRHDPGIVAGGGCEAARIGMSILRDEMVAADPAALVLNAGCPDLPGSGAFPLLYTCNDTGNTGYVGWSHHRVNYGQNVAGHLFKQGRWGIIQPSCLCVGLPGTLEEARLRATATFLTGGQVDIGDDLTTLPEDRWEVLLATLPPSGMPARPVDLFEPISRSSLSYESMCRGDNTGSVEMAGSDVSCVWHRPVDGGWDRWDLVALFNYDVPPADTTGSGTLITRFQLPLDRLGLDAERTYWAYEYWSGQFLGAVPTVLESPHGYTHPGDARTLVATREPGLLEVAFFGPAVKLLVIRPARPHPWVAGTGFHQSGGAELEAVTWEPSGRLRGVLHRPAGQQGLIVIAGCPGEPVTASVGGRPVVPRLGANGALLLPVATEADATGWELRWT